MDILDVVNKADDNDFLLGLLFGNLLFNNDCNKFLVYSKYSTTSVILNKRTITDAEILETHNTLEEKTNIKWLTKDEQKESIVLKKCKIRANNHMVLFNNASNLSYLDVYNKLLTTVLSKKVELKEFLAGLFSCRASPDGIGLVAIDYWYENKYELETKTRALIGLIPLDSISAVVPINFRNLQSDYLAGKKRETQFRIKANWFSANSYLINPYKQECLNEVKKGKGAFEVGMTVPNLLDRVKDYSSYIYSIDSMDDNESIIEEYRNRMGFDNNSSIDSVRDKKLVDIAWEMLPDECAGCDGVYDILDRTFLSKTRKGRPYLEIHHIISLSTDRKLDAEFNLSKLCPACHVSLKRGRAESETQKTVIGKILNHKSTNTNSIESYLNITDRPDVINEIYEKLR